MKKRNVLFCHGGSSFHFFIVLAATGPRAKRHLESVNCGNQMSSIGIAARVWAQDNDGILPVDFRSMSNELSNLRFLICPGDDSRQPAKDWSSLSNTNCSYELLTPRMSYSETNGAFIRCRIHEHLGYPDGSVFDGVRRRTKTFW